MSDENLSRKADTPESGVDGDDRPIGPIRFERFRALIRYWRIRVAHAVLLPELNPAEARELRTSVHQESELTSGFILMCALSAGIATLGLLQSSTAVVIGAMLISPLMNPIAAMGFAFASIDGQRIREAVRVVMIGAAIGVLTGVLITWLSPIRNATPEILARTQPTLLDLAVALFSGIAGGYATVIRKGGTAIGVAIATALMPPLATVGYGIGVLQVRFALGALLLFLTNLAAIAFAFALIARLSGAARPLYRVVWTPKHAAILVAAFLVLAVPLSMTLLQITHEAGMRTAARKAILDIAGGERARIAQIDVKWPLFGSPQVDALVISPNYDANAAREVSKLLEDRMDRKVVVNLQQVQAADLQSQTRAIVDAAMERTVAGISADVPPFARIRGDIGLPTRSVWSDRAQRIVYLEAVRAPGWSLADYRSAEQHANTVSEGWTVRVVPPVEAQLRINLAEPGDGEKEDGGKVDETAIDPNLAIWALQRWGMSRVTLTVPDGPAANVLRKALDDAGILFLPAQDPPRLEDGQALVGVYGPSPSQVAREAAERADAQRKAKEEADRQAGIAASATAR